VKKIYILHIKIWLGENGGGGIPPTLLYTALLTDIQKVLETEEFSIKKKENFLSETQKNSKFQSEEYSKTEED